MKEDRVTDSATLDAHIEIAEALEAECRRFTGAGTCLDAAREQASESGDLPSDYLWCALRASIARERVLLMMHERENTHRISASVARKLVSE
jgi:hypothetical protein